MFDTDGIDTTTPDDPNAVPVVSAKMLSLPGIYTMLINPDLDI
jgi:hypothetical protein